MFFLSIEQLLCTAKCEIKWWTWKLIVGNVLELFLIDPLLGISIHGYYTQQYNTHLLPVNECCDGGYANIVVMDISDDVW